MKKKRVSVQIEGRSYAVISADDDLYVQKVAEEVTESIRSAASSSTQLDTRDCAVLAALNFCDDRNKAVKRNSDVVKKADQIITHTNELNKEITEYKNKLTEAINENTRLSKRIKALDEQLRILLRENEALKKTPENRQTAETEMKFEKTIHDKKAEKEMGYVPMRQYSLFDGEKTNGKKNKNKNDEKKKN